MIPFRRILRLACAGAALFLAVPAYAADPAPADAAPSATETPAPPPFTLAEARLIDAVRTKRTSPDAVALVAAARTYLAQFPQGRFADEALLALGDGLSAAHKTDEAAQTYQRLIDEFPDSVLRDEARVDLLPLLQQQGKPEAAEAIAQQIGGANSLQRDQARLWQARRAFDAKDYPRASTILNAILPGDDLAPAQQTEAVRLLGLSLWNEKRRDLAKHWLQEYLARDDAPETKADIVMMLAGDAESSGKLQDALAYYQQVIDRYPVPSQLPQALYRRADLYGTDIKSDPPSELTQARYRQAIGYYAAYLEINDAKYRPEALHERARLETAAGRPEEALQDYERLAALGEPYRSDVDLLRERVGVLKTLKREDDAAALLDTAVRSSTLAPPVRLTLIMDQAELQYARKNCVSVEKLLQPMPPFAERDLRRRALFMRGFCRYQSGQWEGASVDLETFVQDPDYEPLIVTALLDSYEKSAQYPRLTRTAEDLVDTGRLQPTEPLLLQMGRAYTHLGEPQKIIDVYDRLEKLNPKALQVPAVQMALAIAFESQGNVEQAIARYKTALTLSAGPPPVKEYLDALERIQPLYLRQELYAELVLLNKKSYDATKDEAQRKRIQAWQAKAQLAWGQSLLRKGEREPGIAHLARAKELTSPADGDLRVEVVVAMAQAYSVKGPSDRATQLVKGELKASKTPAQKARLISALVATSADWGTRLAKDGDLDGAVLYYVQALKQLGKDRPQERYALAMGLDPLYAAKGNYAARSQLAAQLSQDPAFESMRGDLVVYRSDVLKGWGRYESQHGRYDSAIKKYSEALDVLPAKEWKRRYDVATAIGQVATAEKDYPEIMSAYEKVAPDIADAPLQAQVRQYMGRIDLEWAAQAKGKAEYKTARTRYLHALELLPQDPPADRLAALHGLSETLVKSSKAKEAAQLLAAESKKLSQPDAQHAVELMVGDVYRESLKDRKQARAWYAKADAGNASGPALEAGMALVALDQQEGGAQAAAQRLEALTKRDLEASPWYVPIHYKLALVYHDLQRLQDAQAEYTLVANTANREARTRYAQAIAESREQAKAIGDYLKITGGAAGSRIAVPKVRESQ